MSDLTPIEKLTIEKALGMGGGYVLEFSNRSLQEFVADSVGLDIEDPKYAYASGSKANRLRAFWKVESNPVVGKLLMDLLTFARDLSRTPPDEELLEKCHRAVARLIGDESMPNAQPLIFVSYARPDVRGVEAIVGLLRDAGLRTWFDKKDLKGGQDWEFEIRKRIEEASLVLVCLSINAVDRRGFFHKEMRYAVDEALKLPKGKVFVMPVRLNDCPVPDDLRKWHALDLFEPSVSRLLLSSIGDALDCGARARVEAHEAFETALREFNLW